ncbi:hypothetical protein SprV_0301205000 [Sparganum proliferum]
MSQSRTKGDILDHFVKQTEKANFRRASLFRSRKNSALLVALGAAAFAIGTYVISIRAVRQERYLDAAFDQLPESTEGQK